MSYQVRGHFWIVCQLNWAMFTLYNTFAVTILNIKIMIDWRRHFCSCAPMWTRQRMIRISFLGERSATMKKKQNYHVNGNWNISINCHCPRDNFHSIPIGNIPIAAYICIPFVLFLQGQSEWFPMPLQWNWLKLWRQATDWFNFFSFDLIQNCWRSIISSFIENLFLPQNGALWSI